MSWKDRLRKPIASTPSAIERISTASAGADALPASEWDAMSDRVLETYAATEQALRPHAEAGTLPPDMILPNGRHVGGVSFHPYDGAETAWRERILSRRLLTGRVENDGTYRFNQADIQRIGDYVVEHIDSLLHDAIENDRKTMEEGKSRTKLFIKNDLKSNKKATVMLAVPEHVAQLKEIAAESLKKDISHYRDCIGVMGSGLDGMESMLRSFGVSLDEGIKKHYYANVEQQDHVGQYIQGSALHVADDFMKRALQPVHQRIAQEISVLDASKSREQG